MTETLSYTKNPNELNEANVSFEEENDKKKETEKNL
jgi:hypothetical protein